jgi:hypothetical protein
MNKRPLSVTVIGWLFIATGAIGFIYHIRELTSEPWIGLVRLLAIVAGAYMLRAQNWARWLALAWMAFHVYVGWLHSWQQAAIHALFLLVLAFFLLRPPAARYFRTPRP